MSREDFLDKLAQSIADGESVDWDEVEKRLPADDDLRHFLKLLRDVAAVGEVHRSLGDEVPPSAASGSTKPAAESASQAISGRDSPSATGQWGHLVLVRKIGEGTFGEVYHAHDTGLDRPVALKLFKPKVTGRETANRILHEARKLARIRHPNIVAVHGAASYDGRVGFWMDLIQGATLEKIVSAGRLSAGEAANVGADVCRALAAVHHAEIIHRDIKAQNVMRAADDGRIVLTDFGAGEFIKELSSSSRGQGTPLYLAPELFSGYPASVQSDLYALGVLLYYLVTGSFPVRGSSIGDLIEAHRRGERRRLRDRRPDLPHSFVAVIERALDPDPMRRFGSAGEMEAALTAGTALPVAPLPVPHPPVDVTIWESVGVARLLTAAALVTLLLGVLACRVFEVALGIDSDFTVFPGKYLQVGVQAFLPFLLFWMAGAALIAGGVGLQPMFRAPCEAVRKRWVRLIEPVEPEALASLIFLAGIGCFVTLSSVCWSIFEAIDALRDGATTSDADLSVLGARGRELHSFHGLYSAVLSFLLALAVFKWFPRLEQIAQNRPRVRLLKWATVVTAVVVVGMAAAPRRFIWESYEVVAYEDQRAFVIGATNDELLLYSPENRDRKRWRVRRDDTALRREGRTGRLFDPI